MKVVATVRCMMRHLPAPHVLKFYYDNIYIKKGFSLLKANRALQDIYYTLIKA